jgi:predicted ferric reductase
MNVRRLAAIDMYGVRGTSRRRRIILAEFLFGVVALVAFGIWLLTALSGVVGLVLGLWAIGAGLNYAPLALHALLLGRPGRLDAELAGVDVERELRRYTVLQLWVFVPLSLVVLSARDALVR